jgi:hypothetical protein
MTCGMLGHVDLHKFTDVSGVLPAFTISLITEEASTSETSIKFYQTTWCNISNGSRLHTHGPQNLKTHLFVNLFLWTEILCLHVSFL